jgi:glycosyltransferase involved in cell wall biosynthesis
MQPFPKISVVTPSFNQAQYLEETINSILSQNYPNLEYVIIDAGSEDGSIDIIKKYSSRLSYWVSEPDRGHADGINKGFSHTSGEIMCWLNSSDVYYPWTLETVAQVFMDIPAAQWITGIPSHLRDGAAPKNIIPVHWNVYDFLSGNYSWIQQESVFWRRGLWEAVGGGLNANIRYACDFELWLRFFQKAPLYHVNTILGGFRYHDDRRGDVNRIKYQQEARYHHKNFYASFGYKDRMLAGLLSVMNNPAGKAFRTLLMKAGLLNWYRYPKINYDFQANRWIKG